MKKVAIVILTYNNLQYNKDCLESIRKYTEIGTYEIIIVDNNSTDGTREWLIQQSDIKLVLNEENVGFPKGCNIGIDLAEKDSDILLLNNDTIVTPRWLENLRKCLYSHKNIGATGAVSLSTANLQGVGFTYNNFEEMQVLADENNISDSSRWEEKLKLIGFCLLIKREVLDKIGFLDERFSPGYYEDDDLGLKIIEAGYKLMLCHDSFIHHYLGTSFRKDQNKFLNLLNINQQKFVDKWGFATHAFDELRGDLIRVIEEPDINKHLNILELGCGLGVTLLKLKNKYKNASLYGIENNFKRARIASKVMSLSTKKVGQFPLEFPQKHFDYIIVNNYIEHMEDPENFLIEIKKYLKYDGKIIAAFQNVANFSVIKDLIQGNWYFENSNGINRNNSIFVTSNDIYKLFDKCGYVKPFLFHWFSWIPEEENRFIEKLCEISGKDKEYLYKTTSYAVKFENNEIDNNREEAKEETKYMLRRIEHDIDIESSIKTIQGFYKENLIDKSIIQELVNKQIINKVKVLNYLQFIN